MNASIAKLITENAKQSNMDEALWNQAKCRIYEQVEMSAKKRNSQTKIDLRVVGMELISKHPDKIKYELESEGYEVDLVFARTPNGTMGLIINW